MPFPIAIAGPQDTSSTHAHAMTQRYFDALLMMPPLAGQATPCGARQSRRGFSGRRLLYAWIGIRATNASTFLLPAFL